MAAKKQSTLKVAYLLFKRDLRQELRTHEMLSAMGLYALLVLVVFGATVAANAASVAIVPVAPGLFWAMLVFTALLGMSRTFSAEKQDGALEGLLLAPISRTAIFWAKAASLALVMLAVEVVCVPLFWFFFLADVPLGAHVLCIVIPLLAGTLGIAGLGTLLATITADASGKDVLLCVLFVPLAYPLLHACTKASAVVLNAAAAFMCPLFDTTFLLCVVLAVVYDVIMFVVCWILYDAVIQA